MESSPGRGRIPLHRSVRHVPFRIERLAGWSVAALVTSLLLLLLHRPLLEIYQSWVEGALQIAQVPFVRSESARLGLVRIPAWDVVTFNPVAHWSGALPYALASLFLVVFSLRLPKVPLPVGAWMTLVGGLLLVTTAVLFWRPLPLLLPANFSILWGQVTFGSALLFPWIWGCLVGVLPLPVYRVALYGFAAWVVSLLWNGLRLAFFLSLARTAGVVWLPPAMILGCTIPDFLVLVIAFGSVLETAGSAWEEAA